jgi:hypothetical protein
MFACDGQRALVYQVTCGSHAEGSGHGEGSVDEACQD